MNPAAGRLAPRTLLAAVRALPRGPDADGIGSTRRYAAAARRSVRTSTRAGLLVVASIALFDAVVLLPLHPADAPVLVGANAALALLAVSGLWALEGRLRNRPEAVAFAAAYAVLLALLATVAWDSGLGTLVCAYLVLVPSLVALIVPWRTGTHVTWLLAYGVTTLAYFAAFPWPLQGGAETRVDFVVVFVAGLGASLAGHALLLRARFRAFARLMAMRRAEATLRESGERFRLLLQQASDAIVIADASGHCLDVNEAACRLVGCTRAELLELAIPDLVPPELNPGQQERMSRLGDGDTVLSERVVRRRDGSLVPVELSARQLPDGRLHAIVRDISARKAAEAERDRLAAAVEQATDFILMTDAGGRILYVNRAFTGITGFAGPEVLGRSVRDVLRSGQEPAEVYAAMDGAWDRGEPWSGHVVDRRSDGRLIDVDAVITPMRDETGAIIGAVEVGRDVSHERALEAQLRQAQKMEAVGRLAGGVAHDFNNLLAAMRGYAELGHQGTQPGDELHEYSSEILKAADRAKVLTQRLLTFARHQPETPAVVDMRDVVGGLVPMLRQIVDERTRLTLELASEPAHVHLDAALLEQAVLNLVINARDAIPAQGTIGVTVHLEEVQAGDRPARQGVGPGRYAVISVSDSGQGIAPEHLPLLFEPFFTTKPTSKGTGLGLSIVYAVVTGAGGHILVDSQLGEGSRFDLFFPIAAAPARGPDPTPRTSDDGPAAMESVLLVEDEEAVRSFVARVLARRGYRVTQTGSAEEALELVGNGVRPALLVTDVLLPTASGPELAENLRLKIPELAVLFISGYEADRLAPDGRFGPGVAFLAKPFASDELLRAARSVLETPVRRGA